MDGFVKHPISFCDIVPREFGTKLDAYFQEQSWELQRWQKDDTWGYQVFFGKDVQVDNLYEYGFPYLYDKEEVTEFALDFYKKNEPDLQYKNNRIFMKLPYQYGLRRYGSRGFYMNFDNIEDLRNELSRYFTPRELNSGIVERLTTFNELRMRDDVVKNDYQNFDVSCYYEEQEIILYDREAADREKKLGVFEVCSPQECADAFGKPVKDGDVLYFPSETHKDLDEQIQDAVVNNSKHAALPEEPASSRDVR